MVGNARYCCIIERPFQGLKLKVDANECEWFIKLLGCTFPFEYTLHHLDSLFPLASLHLCSNRYDNKEGQLVYKLYQAYPKSIDIISRDGQSSRDKPAYFTVPPSITGTSNGAASQEL